jgi:glutaredoxin 3
MISHGLVTIFRLPQIIMVNSLETINNLVSSNKVFLFVKSYCPHSKAARQSLTQAGVAYGVIEIDHLPEKEMHELQDSLAKMTGARTVPRIFVDGCCIGGNSDLQQNYVQTGKLGQLCL